LIRCLGIDVVFVERSTIEACLLLLYYGGRGTRFFSNLNDTRRSVAANGQACARLASVAGGRPQACSV
jgi:hypothetical protein